MNTKQLTALAVGVPVVLFTGVGVAIHRASVHEQICRSYEKQQINLLDSGISILIDMDSAMQQIRLNPFAAFGYMPMISNWKTSQEEFTKKLNDTRYAYVQTCGEGRLNKFIETSEVKDRVKSSNAIYDRIKSF